MTPDFKANSETANDSTLDTYNCTPSGHSQIPATITVMGNITEGKKQFQDDLLYMYGALGQLFRNTSMPGAYTQAAPGSCIPHGWKQVQPQSFLQTDMSIPEQHATKAHRL